LWPPSSARVVGRSTPTGPRRAAARLEDGEQYSSPPRDHGPRPGPTTSTSSWRQKRSRTGTRDRHPHRHGGFMDRPGRTRDHQGGWWRRESGREWIDKYAALGMVQLKLYSSSRAGSLPSPSRRTRRACGCRGISRRVSPPASGEARIRRDSARQLPGPQLHARRERRHPRALQRRPAIRGADFHVRKAVVTVKAGLVYRRGAVRRAGVKPWRHYER